MIGNDVELICNIRRCDHIHQETLCNPGKFSTHHNSASTSQNNCHLVGGIHEFMLFAPYSDSAILKTEQEMRLIRQGYFFSVLKWQISSFLSPQIASFPFFLRYQRHSWWAPAANASLCKFRLVVCRDILCDTPAPASAVICRVVAFEQFRTIRTTRLSPLSFTSLFSTWMALIAWSFSQLTASNHPSALELENPKRAVVSETLTQVLLAATRIPGSVPHKYFSSPIFYSNFRANNAVQSSEILV